MSLSERVKGGWEFLSFQCISDSSQLKAEVKKKASKMTAYEYV